MEFYSNNAHQLFEQYESVSFETVHQEWLSMIPDSGDILDVGSGSGRDAAWFAKKNLHVTAVEPAGELLNLAKRNHTYQNIIWLKDSLPSLSKVVYSNTQFDLILISAVWMHLTNAERKQTIAILKKLLVKGGKLVITLRHGDFNDGRVTYPLSIKELRELAKNSSMNILLETQISDDELGRGNVKWQTVVLGN
ncbi:bifunctional 2-polyprenyl-6-hydroxyphenol methylase/3-demethylubiquinol 3-O-methyltransferase UbiG [Colwellia sp. BRX8-9]|uniref:class I SAM-dependent methyltransferase n=1 Tax=Colwellia sp. BRX8-9 TaxID=2759831 RepID=UPI0015F3A7DD|nr:class I SAM-dependent methyltransferase [Colwellia sp. BRX8-9]MBA6348309.1 class I SAM-dependent methyltransferase [Colwellia sp. BRX8-9]